MSAAISYLVRIDLSGRTVVSESSPRVPWHASPFFVRVDGHDVVGVVGLGRARLDALLSADALRRRVLPHSELDHSVDDLVDSHGEGNDAGA